MIDVAAVKATVQQRRSLYAATGEESLVESADVFLRFVRVAEAAHEAIREVDGLLVVVPSKKPALQRALSHLRFEEAA